MPSMKVQLSPYKRAALPGPKCNIWLTFKCKALCWYTNAYKEPTFPCNCGRMAIPHYMAAGTVGMHHSDICVPV